jgi:prepilin-type processing-associated H-X9-DG protein
VFFDSAVHRATGPLSVGIRSARGQRGEESGQPAAYPDALDGHDLPDASRVYWGTLPYPPRQDWPGVDTEVVYGNAHFNGFNMAFCDGSVRMMNYYMEPETHRRLVTRAEGRPVDAKKV